MTRIEVSLMNWGLLSEERHCICVSKVNQYFQIVQSFSIDNYDINIFQVNNFEFLFGLKDQIMKHVTEEWRGTCQWRTLRLHHYCCHYALLLHNPVFYEALKIGMDPFQIPVPEGLSALDWFSIKFTVKMKIWTLSVGNFQNGTTCQFIQRCSSLGFSTSPNENTGTTASPQFEGYNLTMPILTTTDLLSCRSRLNRLEVSIVSFSRLKFLIEKLSVACMD